MISPISFKKFNDLSKIKPINKELILDGELFLEITSEHVPLIYDYYMISNFGRVYHKYLGKFLSPEFNKAGYLQIMVSTYDKPKPIQIHRLMMIVFNYIPGCEFLDVNHKDGIKFHNVLSNLEWVSRKENIIHAYSLGLMKKGEENTKSKINNETAKQICELLVQKHTSKEIVNIIGGNVTTQIVDSIRKKESWYFISKDYNFYQRKQKMFSCDFVEHICRYFEAHPRLDQSINDYCRETLKYFEINCSEDLVDSLRKIYTRKNYRNISDKYIF